MCTGIKSRSTPKITTWSKWGLRRLNNAQKVLCDETSKTSHSDMAWSKPKILTTSTPGSNRVLTWTKGNNYLKKDYVKCKSGWEMSYAGFSRSKLGLNQVWTKPLHSTLLFLCLWLIGITVKQQFRCSAYDKEAEWTFMNECFRLIKIAPFWRRDKDPKCAQDALKNRGWRVHDHVLLHWLQVKPPLDVGLCQQLIEARFSKQK